MNIKFHIFVLLFILKTGSVIAIPDSLKNSKIYFQFPINSGVSFGKNQNTYGNGGRLAGSLSLYYKRNNLFTGIEIYKTRFKDIRNQNDTFGSFSKIRAMDRVNVVSANIGRTIGSKQNFSLAGGIGYLTFRHPIVGYKDSFLFHSKYTITGIDNKKSICFNSTFKVYLNEKKYRTFGQMTLYTSKQINFASLTAGIEIKLKSGRKALLDSY